MEIVYAVCKIGYEYDDERYNASEEDSATPTGKAYRSKETAEKEALKLNLKAFREIENIEEYAYTLTEAFQHEHNYKNHENILTVDISEYNFHDLEDVNNYINNATDDDLAKLVALMDIKFYEVREIKLID